MEDHEEDTRREKTRSKNGALVLAYVKLHVQDLAASLADK